MADPLDAGPVAGGGDQVLLDAVGGEVLAAFEQGVVVEDGDVAGPALPVGAGPAQQVAELLISPSGD